jgi:CRISPR system Cascade subunit CasB
MTTGTLSTEYAFVAGLQSLATKDNRAALAGLRRGLGKDPSEAFEAHRYIAGRLPENASDWQVRCHYLVAALFALHPETAPAGDGPRSLGAGMARVAANNRAGGESIERRFNALLASDREALPDHLRHAVQLLKGAEVPLDWARLLRDIQHWDAEGLRAPRYVWAREFWRGRAAAQTEEAGMTAAAGGCDKNDEE